MSQVWWPQVHLLHPSAGLMNQMWCQQDCCWNLQGLQVVLGCLQGAVRQEQVRQVQVLGVLGLRQQQQGLLHHSHHWPPAQLLLLLLLRRIVSMPLHPLAHQQQLLKQVPGAWCWPAGSESDCRLWHGLQ
jgi:hypothetical protein